MLSAIFIGNNVKVAKPLEARQRTVFDDSSLRPLLGMEDPALGRVDPLEMNLRVARGVPQLADLEIPRYQSVADEWAAEAKTFMGKVEHEFHKEPAYWENDIDFFRLGCLCEYVACHLGIRYIDEQREVKQIQYTNPSDLFLNGVMDTGQGTCGNMAALHVALGWRLGWPVSLACVASHLFCKYDDGEKRYNIETTNNGQGGWQSHPDDYYRKEYGIPDLAVRCGSDLRAVSRRGMRTCAATSATIRRTRPIRQDCNP